MKAMSMVRPAVTLGFGRFATGMTEMNVATRENYYRLVRDGASGMEYAWDGLVLSRGAVLGLEGVMSRLRGGRLLLNWSNLGLDARGAMEDEVTVVLVNGDRMEMRMSRGVALRGAGCAELRMPSGWSGEEVWCYVMVSHGQEWSESTCVGTVQEGADSMRIAEERNGERNMGTEAGTGRGRHCFGADQSAIKVLLELGQSGEENGEDGGLGTGEQGFDRRE